MSLIDRYIAEVGRHLPEKDRSDIEAEIRSTIEDMSDEREHNTARPADERIIADTLEELGDPQLLAYKYAPPKRYLIGPGWYDVYLTTLRRILLTVLPIFAAVTFILALGSSPLDFAGAFADALSGAFRVGLQILFWVTVVFVLLERSDAIPGESLTTRKGTWTVDQLPDIHRKRQISAGEAVFNIAMLLFLILWIVLPAVFRPVPFLHPDLWNLWLPLLLGILVLSLVHELFQLRIGNWTRPLMVSNVLLGLASIAYILLLVLTQDVIINPAFLATIESSVVEAGSRNAETWAAWTIYISAAILVGIVIWDMVQSIRLAREFEESSS